MCYLIAHEHCWPVCSAPFCEARRYRASRPQRRWYEYLFLFLSDRVGGYVLFLLFYRTGAAGPISAYLVVWDVGVPHCVSGPPHAHMAAGRGLDDLHCLRYCKRDFYHRGCYDHEGPGNRCRLKNHVRSICASLPQPDFVFPGQTAILST